jgi:DNA (cytosine-5)-methyltransferase 1
MFGLRVYRHRLFEASFPLAAPRPCNHARPAMNPHNQLGRDRIYGEFGRQDPEVIWRRDMGVEWMRKYEAREAIPPVMAEWVGGQLLEHITARAAA